MMAKKKVNKKVARSAKSSSRAVRRAKGAKKTVEKKTAPRKPAGAASLRKSAQVPEQDFAAPTRKKGVRKATLTTGIRDSRPARKLGRSRIPIDAPLDVVFQNDTQAREAFSFLGIHSIRELETFNPDDLVMRLTGPAKLTVGRIRKILAMNNRCLRDDEDFAIEFLEELSKPRP